MIPTNAFVIRHSHGGLLAPIAGGFRLVHEPLGGGRWSRVDAEALMPLLPALGVNTTHMTVSPAPCCACCGEWRRGHIAQVEDDDGNRAIRCERHVGRLPCAIEGCGRTFKMTAADGYATSTCCGRHWRMAPRFMREAVARVNRIGKRRGWTMAMCRRHSRLWHRCLRAIRERGDLGGEGHIDIEEIERMFGPLD